MYTIEMHQVSNEFVLCWNSALNHLETKGREAIKWLKCDLKPPFLDHASFRIGNQLFFIRIEDIDSNLDTPSNLNGLRCIARECNGVECLMPMQKYGVNWEVATEGWGLIEPNTHNIIDPFKLVTNENILMTEWELQDFAVQVVRNYVQDNLGHEILSSQGNPKVHPSLWFNGKEKKECVIVGSAKFGDFMPELPPNINDIINDVSNVTDKVHFAKVCFHHPDQKNHQEVLPLFRGHGTGIQFSGMSQIT